jgi:predicted metalloprotease with PDZ domain
MTLSYTIAIDAPHTHCYGVTIECPVDAHQVTLRLPTWTPGSYVIREFARHVQQFVAWCDGEPARWHKVAKDSWSIDVRPGALLRVQYRVYAFDLTVRTAHLDDSHGFFNPACICMALVGRESAVHRLRVEAPAGWRVTTGLDAVDGWFSASDYDELIDSPFECGTHRLVQFEVDGRPHEVALWGTGNEDIDRIVADSRRIVLAARDMFGGLPYRRYVFIVLLADGLYGGLEHRNSVVNLYDRWGFQPERRYERFLGLTAHEFFHVWNVKRIRPQPLGPFDYRGENYTRQLWAMEGITSYYDNLLLVRAGLITPARYLELLAEDIVKHEALPGKDLQSLAESSFDAWIKYYRPDEHSGNSGVSYYLKGSLAALLLDLLIRHRTAGRRSLDDVMRLLFERYPVTGPGFDDALGIRPEVEQVLAAGGAADCDVGAFFSDVIAGCAPLSYGAAFASVGLWLEWSQAGHAWHGMTLKTQHGRLMVQSVRSDAPAALAGIYAGDELIALDDVRIDDERLRARLGERRAGQRVTFSLFRRDTLLHRVVELGAAPAERLRLAPVAGAIADDADRAAWLGLTN